VRFKPAPIIDFVIYTTPPPPPTQEFRTNIVVLPPNPRELLNKMELCKSSCSFSLCEIPMKKLKIKT
jgi:hypothetical protein